MSNVEWIQLGGIFLAVGGLIFVLVLLVLRSRSLADDRLVASDSDNDSDKRILGHYTTAFAETLPGGNDPANPLRKDLRAAGFYSQRAIIDYRAIRNLLVLVVLLATASVALLAPVSYMNGVLVGGLVVTLLAFSLPRVYLAARARNRSRQMERGLPLAIDMLILCLSAGQNLLAAMQQVGQQLITRNPVLGRELTIVYQQAELHSLGYALGQWADRVQVPEVRNLVLVLVQSERLGADATAALDELAGNFRTTARQRAEAQANRASFWMLFPSVFCFWIAAAIALIGPAYLEYITYQERSAEMIREASQQIQQINQTPEQGTQPGQTNSPGMP